MKSKHWIFLFIALVGIAALAQLILTRLPQTGAIATVYHQDTPIEVIDLDHVDTPFYFTITGEGGRENVVFVEPGQISVQSATCPDQICVHQGPITDGARPIVCLPHRIVIQIGPGPDDAVDAVGG